MNNSARRLRLAFIVQRYGERITGGAELLCRQLAEHLKQHFAIEILTTTAKDYTDWRNYYLPGTERLRDLAIHRFPVEARYHPYVFRWRTRLLFRLPHSLQSEHRWIEAQGPFAPQLVKYLTDHRNDYDMFIFFSYRYYPSFFGLPQVVAKSILIPTAEHDRTIHMDAYREFFHRPRAIIYLTPEERELIEGVTANWEVENRVIGIGIEPPSGQSAEAFRAAFNLRQPFLLYVGRIDENKGCAEMFRDLRRYFQEHPGSPLHLILIGFQAMPIPPHPRIRHIGYLNDTDKFNAIAACEALIMPSRFESLSIVTLEALASGKPVLVNGRCEVLLGHARRSQAAFPYADYAELERVLLELERDPRRGMDACARARNYVLENYSWNVVVNRYRELIEELTRG